MTDRKKTSSLNYSNIPSVLVHEFCHENMRRKIVPWTKLLKNNVSIVL